MENFIGTVIVVFFIIIIIWVIVYFAKAGANKKLIYDDKHFKQANIEVVFASGKIIIDKIEYKVSQVTGMHAEPLHSNRYGDSRVWLAILNIDDFKKPKHQITFPSRDSANVFIQRLSTALRKAGGPSFV